MTFNISYNFEAIDKFTNVSRKISKSIDRLTAKISKFRQKVKGAGKSMTDLGKKMMLRVTAPLTAFGILAVKSASNIEDMNIAFTGMLHSATKAKAMVKSLIEFTARTPFELPEVQHAAQQLLTFGFTTKQVIPLLTELGNIAAVKKVPLSDLASVFGRVHARGKATVRELMPLIRMGTPLIKVLQKMAKEAGHAGIDVFKVAGKGAVTAKVWDAAFLRMTTGAGMFAGAAVKMAHSVSGLFSTLKDNLKLVMVPMGDMIIDSLNLKKNMQGFIDVLGRLRIKIAAFEKAHKQLSKLIVLVGLLTAALAPVLVTIGTIVFLFGLLISPVTLVIAGIVAIGMSFTALYLTSEKFRKGITDTLYALKIFEPALLIIKGIIFGVVKGIIWIQKLTSGAIINNFKRIYHIIKAIEDSIIKIIHYIGKISSLFSHHKGTVEIKKSMMMQHSPFFTRQQTFAPLTMPQQRVRSDVNISLHDPGGFINRMTGKSDGGDLGFNLGTNMLSSYL